MKIRKPALLLTFLIVLCLSSLASFAQTGPSSNTEAKDIASQKKQRVIARIWHGRTRAAKADEYYEYLKEAGIKKILAIEGNLGAQVFIRKDGDIAEFTVISYWESFDAIRKFAGNDVEKTHNLAKDPEYLLELEPTVKHYEVLLDERRPL